MGITNAQAMNELTSKAQIEDDLKDAAKNMSVTSVQSWSYFMNNYEEGIDEINADIKICL